MSGWGEEYTQPLNEPGSGRGDRMGSIGTDMRKVSRKITQLRKEAGMIGTARDSHELRSQIHRTREEATKTMKQAASALRESQSDPKIRADPDQRSALNQLESDFEQLHQLYASVLEETQRKMRDNVLTSDSVPHSQSGAAPPRRRAAARHAPWARHRLCRVPVPAPGRHGGWGCRREPHLIRGLSPRRRRCTRWGAPVQRERRPDSVPGVWRSGRGDHAGERGRG